MPFPTERGNENNAFLHSDNCRRDAAGPRGHGCRGARAQPAPAWHEGFEGPEPSWQDAGGDARYRVVEHRRLQGDAHAGSGCEWLRVEADGGSHVYFAHDVGRPRVIDDLVPSVWIKSDRPGVQLAARIVLPRSVDPHTGRPVTAIVTGSGYTDVGRWQQLRIEHIPRLLTRQVHLLRMQLGPQVDDREAYLDAVLLERVRRAGHDQRLDRRSRAGRLRGLATGAVFFSAGGNHFRAARKRCDRGPPRARPFASGRRGLAMPVLRPRDTP